MLQAFAPETICKRSRDVIREEAVHRVIVEMRSRLSEPLNLKGMAEIAYFSPFHFNRVFKELTGVPPIQFLYALRLQRAKELLQATDLSVTNICLEVGYNSLGSFTNRFTELVGLSPNAYRRFSREFCALDIGRIRSLFSSQPDGGKASVGLEGTLRIAGRGNGMIFVALFSRSIPERWPVSYRLMSGAGRFRFAHARPGRYRVLALGLPVTSNPVDMLTLTNACRARSERCRIEPGRVTRMNELRLAPTKSLDPPILSAVPLLTISGLLGRDAPAGSAAWRRPGTRRSQPARTRRDSAPG